MLLQAQSDLDVTAPIQASLRVSYDEDPLASVLNHWAACNLHGTTPGPRQDPCVHLSGSVVSSQPVEVRVSLSLKSPAPPPPHLSLSLPPSPTESSQLRFRGRDQLQQCDCTLVPR